LSSLIEDEVRKIVFDYHDSDNRLWLKQINETAKDKSGTYFSKSPYSFEYHARLDFPAVLSPNNPRDYWGYYNGKNNSGRYPIPIEAPAYHSNLSFDNPNVNPGCDRTPDGEFVFYGLMSKITFPSGAAIELEYEENEFNNINAAYNLYHGAGARVKKVKNLNNDNSYELIKTIDYRDSNGSSSGRLFSIPFYNYNSSAWLQCNDGNEGDIVSIYSPEPVFPLVRINGGYVGYSNVKVQFGDDSEIDKYGYQISSFYNYSADNHELYGKFTYPAPNSLHRADVLVGNYHNVSDKYGRLKSLQTFSKSNGNFNLERQKDFEYKLKKTIPIKGYKLWWNFPFDIDAGLESELSAHGVEQIEYMLCVALIGKKYVYTHDYYSLFKEKETIYKNGEAASLNSTTYYYDFSFRPIRIESLNSLNGIISKNTEYSQTFNHLPIAVSEVNGRTVVSKKKFEYNSLGLLKTEFIGLSGSINVNEGDYDSDYRLGKLIEYNEDFKLKKVVYPYNKSVSFVTEAIHSDPICEVVNAEPSEIAYTSFETTSKGNFNYDNTFREFEENSSNARTGQYYFNLNSGSIKFTRTLPTDGSFSRLVFWSTNPESIDLSLNAQIESRQIKSTNQNGWSLLEFIVSGSGEIEISGNGLVDELRYFPQDALMKSVNFDLRGRIITETGYYNKSIHYNYDVFDRIKLITDENNNVLEKTSYNYGN
jgi:hypothetical protein